MYKDREHQMQIRYINTDLDLACPSSLQPIVDFLSARGAYALSCEPADDGWHACLETEKQFRAADHTIAAFLDALDRMDPETRSRWDECTLREFNIGYDAGDKPWAFNDGLSAMTVQRIARLGATIRVTIYPPARDDCPPESNSAS